MEDDSIALTTSIRSALSSLGWEVHRIRPAPYDELWAVPRYTPQTVSLLGHPFRIADSHSFVASYREIFIDGIYRFVASSPEPLIIDCGANYGTSVVYFKQLYPQSRLVAIEADPGIFALLERNCAHLDVQLLKKAVSDSAAPTLFYSEGADGGRAHHALSQPRAVTEVESVTLDDLIDGHVDMLKVDIEGSETAAITACTKLADVDHLFIEYHSFLDSPQTLHELLSTLSAHGFRYYIRHVFCPATPLTACEVNLGMDLQLNIFARHARTTERTAMA